MKKHGVLFWLLCVWLGLQPGLAQEKKEGGSLLWEISGNGSAEPSYLYGTMHVSDKLVYNVQDAFYDALRSVDVVALELNLDSMLALYFSHGSFYEYEEMMGRYGLGGDFYTRMTTSQDVDQDFFKEELASKDNLLNGLLYRKWGGEEEYEEQTYLDLFIFQAAKKLGKQIASLENRELTEKYRYLARIPDEEEEDEDFEDYIRMAKLFAQLEKAYREGNLEMIDSIIRAESGTGNYMHYFIIERNRMMANTIDSVMKTGRSIFGACGVAHLPGDSGVIEMLRSYGYTLKPCRSEITARSHKNRRQIERMICPQEMKTFSSMEGGFSVMVPGRLYKIPNPQQIERYIYPDMANGSFYQVSHYYTYGNLTGRNRVDHCRRFDSIVYEVVPGDILKQTVIKQGAYTVYDITSQISLDHCVRSRVFIGDCDIYIFKLSGMVNYVNSGYCTTFFNSIRLHNNGKEGPSVIDLPRAGICVEMPGITIAENNLTPAYGWNASGNVDVRLQSYDPGRGDYFLITAGSLFDFSYLEEDRFELDYLTEKVMKDRPGRRITELWSESGDRCELITTYKDTLEGYTFVKATTRGPQYHIMLVRKADETIPYDFFNSLQFQEYECGIPLVDYHDKDLLFDVTTTPFIGEKEKFTSTRYRRMLDSLIIPDEEDYVWHVMKSQFRVLRVCSGLTPECVEVERQLFNYYYTYPSLDSLWRAQKKYCTSSGDLTVLSESYSASPCPEPWALFILGDTNTKKTLIVKKILKDGALYSLTAVGSQGDFCGEWTRNFFETFTPADTFLCSSPVQASSVLFLDHLSAEDSSLRKRAFALRNYVRCDSLLTAGMMKYVQTADFRKLSGSKRCDLIGLMADSTNMEPLAFLERFYKEAGDSARYQKTVLKVLAAKKSEAALDVFCRLLVEDPPLYISSYEVDNWFVALSRSHRAEMIFPRVLALTRYKEYRLPVYKLMAKMLDRGTLEPKLYQEAVDDILLDAQEVYKRVFAINAKYEETKRSSYSYYDDLKYLSFEIESYVQILMPYRDRDDVKRFFERCERSQTENFTYPLLMAQIEAGAPYSESLLADFIASDRLRINTYLNLEKMQRLDLFDSTYYTQEAFARSDAFPDKVPLDTIVFVERVWVDHKEGPGYVYFFKCKDKLDKNWRLRYSGIQPADGAVEPDPQFSSTRGSKVESDAMIRDFIKTAVEKIRLRDRERVSNRTYYYDDYY
jgi:uncharacterized protein YbaP (TraB family)